MPAIGQNVPQNTSEKADEQAERSRIKSERAKLNENLAQQRQACYQKLAVTPCLNDARDQHSEKMRDLKRQEVALNDVQRKRAAADRVRALDQRNSPEAQLKRAQDRGKAMQDTQQREQGRAQRQAGRDAKQSETERAANPAQASIAPKALPETQGKARKPSAPKVAPAQRPGQAAKMEKSRQQAALRQKDTAERRAKALEREAKRKKPPAAGLPLPL